MEVTRRETRLLFPTRLVTYEHAGAGELNGALSDFFASRKELEGDFDMHPDSFNLLDWSADCPAIGRLAEVFLGGVRDWLEQEGIRDAFDVDVTLFSNIARRGDFTIAHNHSTTLAGVYYVKVPPHDDPPLEVPTPDSEYTYFDPADGALVLHDPRFNANLVALGGTDYARVRPKPGLMVIFPGYLWHSVTPSTSEALRLSIAANFSLVPRRTSKAQRHAL